MHLFVHPPHGCLMHSQSASFSHQTQSPQEVRYRHTLDAALTIWRSEGVRAFYRGLLPSILGILHVAVQFPLYEQLKIISREHLFTGTSSNLFPTADTTIIFPNKSKDHQTGHYPARRSSSAPP
jgi:hypothetical protein